MIDKNLVLKLAEERIQELNRGLFIVELSISTRNVISIELDREEGGVSIEDCISVSRNVEHNLDRETVDFELNVSSAGMDRPLRHHKQFVKNTGRRLTFLKKDGVQIEGTLTSFTSDSFIVTTERIVKNEKNKNELIAEELTLLAIEIKEIKRVISFK
ncbi:MAG: ribosome assembly cofactor RimP [Crocinitomicaceae bacterium]|nr:ribosome assembly cofactor RimP [Crocinitomicaceae bacterium]